MKKAVIFFSLMLFFAACDNNESVDKTTGNDSANKSTVKYPLPKKADSLFMLAKILPDDTNKVNVLNALGYALKDRKPDTSIIIVNDALSLAEKLTWKKGIAFSYGYLGMFYRQKGEYSKSLDYGQKALKLNEEIDNKKEIAANNVRIGLTLWNQGDLPEALGYYLAGLKIYEQIDNKDGISITLGNIGIVYKEQGDYDKALEYYFKSLKIKEELGSKTGMVSTLGNIGNVYKNQANATKDNAERSKLFASALDYYSKALKLAEELDIKDLIANWLGNIGGIYSDMAKDNKNLVEADAQFKTALDYYSRDLKMAEEFGSRNSQASTLANIGSIYIKIKKFNEAYSFLYRALALSDSIGAKGDMKYSYEQLSRLYEYSEIPLPDTIGGKMLSFDGMHIRALHYFKSSIALRDTIFSEENKKQLVRKEMNFDFEKKEAEAKAKQDIKDALSNEELKQKEQERNYFIGGFALVILLAGFIFRGYRQKKKANEIISLQKALVEEKQKEIIDSIHYAQRIQKSLLPTEKYIERSLDRLNKNN